MDKDIGTGKMPVLRGISVGQARRLPSMSNTISKKLGFSEVALSPRRWVAATGLRQLWQGSNCQISGAAAGAGANLKT
ncbi:MAG: hypothetical protein KME26_22915 [Oscillatoria princeps RMCB-10]|nr:hypothetical protein [Oscillatoria princeps RMCB-10]